MLHSDSDNKILKIARRYPRGSGLSDPPIPESWRRYLKCYRGIGARWFYLLWNSRFGIVGLIGKFGCFKAPRMVVAETGAIRWFQRQDEQVNRLVLFFLGGGGVQHREWLFQRKGVDWRAPVVLLDGSAAIHPILLPGHEGRALGQTWKGKGYIPYDLCVIGAGAECGNEWLDKQ